MSLVAPMNISFMHSVQKGLWQSMQGRIALDVCVEGDPDGMSSQQMMQRAGEEVSMCKVGGEVSADGSCGREASSTGSASGRGLSISRLWRCSMVNLVAVSAKRVGYRSASVLSFSISVWQLGSSFACTG
jgi:hypothetical protein